MRADYPQQGVKIACRFTDGKKRQFRAIDFIAKYTGTHAKGIDPAERTMLHEQIAHLGKQRTKDLDKKLNGPIRHRMFEAIKLEVREFLGKLPPEDAKLFEAGLLAQCGPLDQL